jgi:hypothetical protein
MKLLTRQTNSSSSSSVENIENDNSSLRAEGLVCLGLIGFQIELLERRAEKLQAEFDSKVASFNNERIN